ncbi:MAG: hypothetical protein FWC11_04415 [Firmicutes bacterium]|nr:hypothetical protein [Bacillota bacterium]
MEEKKISECDAEENEIDVSSLKIREDISKSEENVSIEKVQREKANFITKKRIATGLVAVVMATLITLYATSVIPSTIFTIILLTIGSVGIVVITIFLIINTRKQKKIKKLVLMLVKLLSMGPLLILYLTATIDSSLFVILKIVLIALFLTLTIGMFLMSRLKNTD